VCRQCELLEAAIARGDGDAIASGVEALAASVDRLNTAISAHLGTYSRVT
jgi:hypothetical protein